MADDSSKLYRPIDPEFSENLELQVDVEIELIAEKGLQETITDLSNSSSTSREYINPVNKQGFANIDTLVFDIRDFSKCIKITNNTETEVAEGVAVLAGVEGEVEPMLLDFEPALGCLGDNIVWKYVRFLVYPVNDNEESTAFFKWRGYSEFENEVMIGLPLDLRINLKESVLDRLIDQLSKYSKPLISLKLQISKENRELLYEYPHGKDTLFNVSSLLFMLPDQEIIENEVYLEGEQVRNRGFEYIGDNTYQFEFYIRESLEDPEFYRLLRGRSGDI